MPYRGLRFQVCCEETSVAIGYEAGHSGIEFGLHRRCAAAVLQAGKQRVLLHGRVFDRICAGLTLPHPEMSPLLGHAVPHPTASARSGDAKDLRQSSFRFVAVPGRAVHHGKNRRARCSAEPLGKAVRSSADFKTDIDFRMTEMISGDHALLRLTGDFGLEEERPMRGLHQRTFADFIGSADEGQGTIEFHLQIAVNPVVPNGDGRDAHGELTVIVGCKKRTARGVRHGQCRLLHPFPQLGRQDWKRRERSTDQRRAA